MRTLRRLCPQRGVPMQRRTTCCGLASGTLRLRRRCQRTLVHTSTQWLSTTTPSGHFNMAAGNWGCQRPPPLQTRPGFASSRRPTPPIPANYGAGPHRHVCQSSCGKPTKSPFGWAALPSCSHATARVRGGKASGVSACASDSSGSKAQAAAAPPERKKSRFFHKNSETRQSYCK